MKKSSKYLGLALLLQGNYAAAPPKEIAAAASMVKGNERQFLNADVLGNIAEYLGLRTPFAQVSRVFKGASDQVLHMIFAQSLMKAPYSQQVAAALTGPHKDKMAATFREYLKHMEKADNSIVFKHEVPSVFASVSADLGVWAFNSALNLYHLRSAEILDLTKVEAVAGNYELVKCNYAELAASGISYKHLHVVFPAEMIDEVVFHMPEGVHLSAEMPNMANLTLLKDQGCDFLEVGITTISGDDFLSICAAAKRASLPNVTTIGGRFLANRGDLREVDLSPLRNIETIGVGFLEGCRNLTEVDLSGFINVKTIGDSFLNCCYSLEKVDLSSFVNVTAIGGNFLFRCSSLQAVDLSQLINVETIRYNFLFECSSLQAVDLSQLVNVETIGIGFLHYCFKLESLTMPPNVRRIDLDKCLKGCDNLKTIKMLIRNL